ncbi:MAG: GAF domain-containing protein, partial [Anaerolineales bacterium]
NFQEVLSQFIPPSLVHLYLYNPTSNQYTATQDGTGQPTSDLYFSPDCSLVKFLAQLKRPFSFGDKKSLPDELQDEYSRMALLGADLFIPLPGQKELVGWLALNLCRSPRRFRSNDIAALESLCNQAAIAIERSLVISNLERRVREMDVLTRIAQGVNITLDFDNILELIYAQTNLVIPSIDFRITLQSSITHRNYHAFYLEKDDRLAHNENIDIPSRNGLEEIIIRNQRALVTPDYERECRKWGVMPNMPDVYAWIGVPLNAGSETIGAICLGNRDPSIVYSDRQRDLLQAIADQAAGAIVKTRLLSESERRARQLAKLNEVGRGLASTLDIKPLLTQIMSSAVELLNCEAGSLIMVDENTQELVFQVTVGPISGDLTGTRLPAGTGLVGKAAKTGEPVIANHMADAQSWIDEADQQTGYLTRDFLAVPMKVKETTIGVIQVINKLDGAAFTQDDQEILSTFTSQAAVAVENARLYTHTASPMIVATA